MAARRSCAPTASTRSTSSRWASNSATSAASRRDPRLRRSLGLDRRPAAADLCRAARRREEAGRRRRCLPPAAREPWRAAGADRRGPAARADRGARRSDGSSRRAMSTTGRSWRAGWRAPTSTFGHGRRDLRRFDRRGAGVGPAGRRGRRRSDDRPGDRTRSAGSGPVGDAEAMAREYPRRVERRPSRRWAKRRCDDARQFSWDSSMEALFGRVYPAAFARRDGRMACGRAGEKRAGPGAEAC